jgi:hypothetical protein
LSKRNAAAGSMERESAGLGRETEEILNFVSTCFVGIAAELPNKFSLHGTSSEKFKLENFAPFKVNGK